MKRFWWGSVILLLCLTYFVIGSAGGTQNNIGVRSLTLGSEGVASPNMLTRRKGGHIHLRPTAATPEALTLYEQARANLVAQ
jgi:hypothetical protein